MSRFRRSLLCLGLALPLAAQAAPGALPDGAAWIAHARRDLLPWWTQAGALGQPVGRFPTFRCHDGAAYQAGRPCQELANAPEWIRSELGRDYVRMQARQVFAYGMGFHLTGDPRLLHLAEAGVRDIRRRALDPATGSPVTYWEHGQGLPAVELRTAQDVAYAGAALAVWYYLTRDAATLADLDRLHRHLMTYLDPATRRMRWTLGGAESERAELVAQLDPLNAYMVLVTPLLPGELRARWLDDMRRLTTAIREQFCDAVAPRCRGVLGEAGLVPGARHNDFGHTAKAFWMTWLAAEQLGDPALADWARTQGGAVLRDAYFPATGSWARRWSHDGVQPGNDWWIHAELDQLAATRAMRERGEAGFLSRTQPFWLEHFVAPREVWPSVSPTGRHDPGALVQHQWKNGYHAMEHALVSYIAAQVLAGRPVRLYYAPGAAKGRLVAYYFGGRVARQRIEVRRGGRVLAVDLVLPAPADSADPVPSLAPPEPPGAPVALTAENAGALLLGRWEGHWYADEFAADGPVVMQLDALEQGRLRGSWTAQGTPDDAHSRDVGFEAPATFEDGQMILGPSGSSLAVTYTLRRDGDTQRLESHDRSRGFELRAILTRTAP